MKYIGNIKENLAKMRDYFVNVLNFECVEGENLYYDSSIECELFLIKRDVGLRISIVKHYDDDEIDFIMSGHPDEAEKYYDYIDCFLNKKNIDKEWDLFCMFFLFWKQFFKNMLQFVRLQRKSMIKCLCKDKIG